MVNITSPILQQKGLGATVPVGWQECTLTRANEIEALCQWSMTIVADQQTWEGYKSFEQAISSHLRAAREAAGTQLVPRRWWWRVTRSQARRERAMSNIDAAEVALLNIAPSGYILGQLTSLQEHVRCHLVESDPRRVEFEKIVDKLSPHSERGADEDLSDVVRGKIAAITRAASSAALREQVRVRSFYWVVVITAITMFVLAAWLAIMGLIWPTLIPLCFEPESAGQAMVVCATQESMNYSTVYPPEAVDLDGLIASTVRPYDILVIELVGLIAAALAATNTIRKIRGSSERYRLPFALAALKLPTGAITAFLGLLLIRGQFVPGLSALDTPSQILAWALVFGYSQQLFTRFVDRKGQAVLDSVRGADLPRSTPDPLPPLRVDPTD